MRIVGPYTDPEHMSLALVDSLICFEMPIFAIAHVSPFKPPFPFYSLPNLDVQNASSNTHSKPAIILTTTSSMRPVFHSSMLSAMPLGSKTSGKTRSTHSKAAAYHTKPTNLLRGVCIMALVDKRG